MCVLTIKIQSSATCCCCYPYIVSIQQQQQQKRETVIRMIIIILMGHYSHWTIISIEFYFIFFFLACWTSKIHSFTHSFIIKKPYRRQTESKIKLNIIRSQRNRKEKIHNKHTVQYQGSGINWFRIAMVIITK